MNISKSLVAITSLIVGFLFVFSIFGPSQVGAVGSTNEPEINDAQFISDDMYEVLIQSEHSGAWVKFKNTGTSTWTTAKGYKLGSQNPEDNNTWGKSRYPLPHDVIPGQEVSFLTQFSAPNADKYNFQWQMIQEGVQWFGAKSTNKIITVLPNNNTPTPTTIPQINPICTINQGLVYLLGSTRLATDPNIGSYYGEIIPVSMPAGTYNVSLQGFDSHSQHGGQNQAYEQFNVVFLNANGTSIGAVGPSLDIPENQNYSPINTRKVVINENITGIYSAHAYLNDTSSPNSLLALCAGFVAVNTPTNTPPPTPTVNPTPTPTIPPSGIPNLIVDKGAWNKSIAGSQYGEVVVARPGDTIEFTIAVGNNGTGFAKNVLFGDVLPPNLIYVNGSTKLDGNSVSQDSINNPVSLGDLGPGQVRRVSLLTRVADINSFPSGSTTLRNDGHAIGSNTSRVFDPAYVKINISTTIPTTTPTTTPTPIITVSETTLSIDKKVGQGSDIRDTFPARIGELVGFVINITNTGNSPAINATFGDVLSPNYSYVQGSTTLNGVKVAQDGINSPVLIGTLNSKETVQVTLQAYVVNATNAPLFHGSLIPNDGHADADNANKVIDTAYVKITDINHNTPTLSIKKSVRKEGTTTWKNSIDVEIGDTVEFKITTTNIGNGFASYVYVGDVPSPYFRYVSGSTKLDGNNALQDGINSPVLLGDLGPNQSRTVTLKMQVIDLTSSPLPIGKITLQNDGHSIANNAGRVIDNASVKIEKNTTNIPGTNTTLTLEKTVINISDNTSEQEHVSADKDEIVEFVIRVKNTGSITAKNVRIIDSLPSGITYLSNSTRVDGNLTNDITNDLVLGDINVGQIKTIRFNVRVTDSSTRTITNFASVNSSNANNDNDTAQIDIHSTSNQILTCSPSSVTIKRNQSYTFTANNGFGYYNFSAPNANTSSASGTSNTFTTYYSNTGNYIVTIISGNQNAYCNVTVINNDSNTTDLNIDKQVRNITQNINQSDNISAHSNDTLEFIITITNNNNSTATNVIIRDNLPDGFIYQNGSTTVDGITYNDGLINNGVNVGSMSIGQTKTIRFRANVRNDNYFSETTTTLNNWAHVHSDQNTLRSDNAIVRINKSFVSTNSNNQLSIQKFGKNITKGETTDLTKITANPNDTLEFVLVVRNVGNTTLYNVIVRDVLPSGLSYINNTTSVNRTIVSNGIIDGGINVGTLTPNQELLIRFNTKVNGSGSFTGTTTSISNLAFVRADNVSESGITLPITIAKSSILAIVGQIPTGGNLAQSLVALTLLSALSTSMYAVYTRTEIFKRRDSRSMVRSNRNNSEKFNFA